MAAPNYYEILHISPQASATEIEAAFKRLAQRYSEDSNPTAEKNLNLVLDAYRTLSAPERRAAYDQAFFQAHPQQRISFWQRLFKSLSFSKPANKGYPAGQEGPTFTQLLDFDWEALEEPTPQTPAKRKAFWDEVSFKVIIILLFLILIVLLYWANRS
jgi:curved DNA-binding protein CbpA